MFKASTLVEDGFYNNRCLTSAEYFKIFRKLDDD